MSIPSFNGTLKAGFIFVLVDDVREVSVAYLAWRCGGIGYFSRLDAEACNGHTPVPSADYATATL